MASKGNSRCSLITMLSIKFGWNWVKTMAAETVESVKIENFPKNTKWPQTELKWPDLGLRVPNIYMFRSTFSRFQIFHILWFSIDSDVKMSKCHKLFKTWLIAKKSNRMYSPMVANVLITFGRHQMKTLMRSGVLKFPAPYVPVLTKILKCHKLLFLAICQK